jgi:hypothetical protein
MLNNGLKQIEKKNATNHISRIFLLISEFKTGLLLEK